MCCVRYKTLNLLLDHFTILKTILYLGTVPVSTGPLCATLQVMLETSLDQDNFRSYYSMHAHISRNKVLGIGLYISLYMCDPLLVVVSIYHCICVTLYW